MVDLQLPEKIEGLTPKEELFIREYLVDFNASRAYVAVGYAPNNADVCAYKMLVKPRIQAAVERVRAERCEKIELNADYVLNTIRRTIERCSQTEPVFDARGKPTGQFKYEAQAVLKGCELLGKHLKLYTDKVEATGLNGEKLFNEIRIIAGKVNIDNS